VRPDLLLLDEAFSSLDVILKLDIFKVLGTLWEAERFTLMTVTHNPRDALLTADRILILGGSPMHVLRELRLPPRVRSSSDPEVLETENQILRCLSETP
ncbi:MAG: ABC transporter ATP-binding protein, partial [Fretibacterium sp.]|nr:ABC transporter ATP-binding protein [Fretibacterium sp.]